MSRLYRPHIPLEIRCRVALRQVGGFSDINRKIELEHPNAGGMGYGRLLADLMIALAGKFGCTAAELRLDHNPPLGARPQHRRGLGRKIYYQPDANHPDHLNYRPHGPQYAGSHLIKTNVRGDGAQYPDRVLIKRERRRLRKKKKTGKGSGLGKRRVPGKPTGRAGGFKRGPKLQSASRWPKGRKIASKRNFSRES